MPNYKSGFERTLAAQLKRLRVKFEYETVQLPYILRKTYSPDFVILENGVLIEAKGVLDDDTRAKMLAVKEMHPDRDIRFVFMNANNKIRKGSKTTYAAWAEKHGFPWAEKEIPKEWLAKRI